MASGGAWFPANPNRFGGISPTWQGWALLCPFSAIAFYCIYSLTDPYSSIALLSLNLILGFAVWLKSDKPLSKQTKLSIMILAACSFGFIGTSFPVEYHTLRRLFPILQLAIIIVAIVRFR